LPFTIYCTQCIYIYISFRDGLRFLFETGFYFGINFRLARLPETDFFAWRKITLTDKLLNWSAPFLDTFLRAFLSPARHFPQRRWGTLFNRTRSFTRGNLFAFNVRYIGRLLFIKKTRTHVSMHKTIESNDWDIHGNVLELSKNMLTVTSD